MRFLIRDLRIDHTRAVEVGRPDVKNPERGWVGWSLGAMGTGAQIELDELLEGIQLGIFPASSHMILLGRCSKAKLATLPAISVRVEDEGWVEVDPGEYANHEGELRVRFDRQPLRIGEHVIEML